MFQERELSVVILAAGQGTRMKSSLPKVLHRIGGKPMLAHVIDQARGLRPARLVVVYGHGGEALQAHFKEKDILWALQAQQRGTADAVATAVPLILPHHRLLILYGDTPLITSTTLEDLLSKTPTGGVGLVTAQVDNPFGLGRIVRDEQGQVKKIVEEKDAASQERNIHEVNSGIMLFDAEKIAQWLPQIHNNNTQEEFYLTDIVALAVKEKSPIYTTFPQQAGEIQGVNDRVQQAEVERLYQRMQAHRLMREGVEMSDPDRVDIRGELRAEKDVFIDVNTVFEGKNDLREGCRIGPHCVLINCQIGARAMIQAHSHLENAVVGAQSIVGPFARLRPGTTLAAGVHIGNFVEIKNSTVDTGTKINHLSYIGDAIIGKAVNIGAGTITCNYDGANKYQTIIEDDVHIGSDSQLVAPVCVKKGATVGAGSTLIHDAPAEQLTLTHHLEQRSQSWQRPTKDGKDKE